MMRSSSWGKFGTASTGLNIVSHYIAALPVKQIEDQKIVEITAFSWYTKAMNMNTKRVWYSTHQAIDSPDMVHQTLMFGTLKEIQSLKNTVGETAITELFLRHPKKVYTAPALNFIKNFVLHINTAIDEQQYLKHTPRAIR